MGTRGRARAAQARMFRFVLFRLAPMFRFVFGVVSTADWRARMFMGSLDSCCFDWRAHV